MRFVGPAIIFAAVILFSGCAQTVPVVPDGNVRITEVPLSAAGSFERPHAIQIVPDSAAGGISILGGYGGTRYTIEHAAWSEAVCDALLDEFGKRGSGVSADGARSLRFRITGATSASSGDRINVEVRATLESEDGSFSRTYIGGDAVVYSALLAFQGAVEDLMKNILSDSELQEMPAEKSE